MTTTFPFDAAIRFVRTNAVLVSAVDSTLRVTVLVDAVSEFSLPVGFS